MFLTKNGFHHALCTISDIRDQTDPYYAKVVRILYSMYNVFCCRYITDKMFNNNKTICQSNKREEHVMSSNGHVVEIQIVTKDELKGQFLFKYEGK